MTEQQEQKALDYVAKRRTLNEARFHAYAPYIIEGLRIIERGFMVFLYALLLLGLPSMVFFANGVGALGVIFGLLFIAGVIYAGIIIRRGRKRFVGDVRSLAVLNDLEKEYDKEPLPRIDKSEPLAPVPVPSYASETPTESPNPSSSPDAIVPPPIVLIDDEPTAEPVEEKPRVDLERELEGAANRLVEERRAEQFEEVYNLRANAAGFSLEPFHRAGRATSDKLGVDATELLDATTPAKVASAWPGFYAAALEAGKRNPTAARECAEEIRAARAAFAALPKDPRFNP